MTDCEHSPTMRLFAINTVPGADGCPICLAAENAALRKDAERYRWLRDRAWPFEFNGDTPEDADAAIDAAMHLAARPAAAKKHTPECSYWDGLMAQVCNCGLTERCCVDYPRCDCNSPPEPDSISDSAEVKP
jgi:hypothetical protein